MSLNNAGGSWQGALQVSACKVWAGDFHPRHSGSPGWPDELPPPGAAAEVSRQVPAQDKIGAPKRESLTELVAHEKQLFIGRACLALILQARYHVLSLL